ncbi:class I SAM-dependent methyltransferase [bacterium]|nr:class I SAM-dependent methyltransferase [bacterium]
MLETVEKSWNEFWAYYFRIELRHKIPGIAKWDEQLVKFIEKVCELRPPARVLDLACGGGDQAKLFAAKGYEVTGIDIAPSLVEYAKKKHQDAGLDATFLVGDMREIEYDSEFELCTVLSGSFGFFKEDENQQILGAIRSALVPGGKVFIMFISPARATEHIKSWSEVKDGWELSERWFEAESSTYRARAMIIRRDGTIIVPKSEPDYNADEVIRCYTVPELKRMLSEAGLRYAGCYNSRALSSASKSKKHSVLSDIVVATRSS